MRPRTLRSSCFLLLLLLLALEPLVARAQDGGDGPPSEVRPDAAAPAGLTPDAAAPAGLTPDAAPPVELVAPVLEAEAGTPPRTELTGPAPARRGSLLARRVTRYSIVVGVPLLATIYGQSAWDWGSTQSWTWGFEGWFGAGTPHGGSDKIGHAYAHYVLFRSSEAVFEWTENGARRRTLLALALAGGVGLGIEVGDAYNGSYGFSYADLIADFLGIGLGAAMEEYPALEDLVGFSAEYVPTRGFLDAGNWWLDFAEDYSGWKVMLNLKLAGAHHLGLELPRALDFFSFDVGWYTKDYQKFDAGYPDAARYVFVGASLNVPELIDLAFRRSNSLPNRALREVFGYVHLPLGYKLTTNLD